MYNCIVYGIREDSWNDLWNGMFMKFTAKKIKLSELQSTKLCINK